MVSKDVRHSPSKSLNTKAKRATEANKYRREAIRRKRCIANYRIDSKSRNKKHEKNKQREIQKIKFQKNKREKQPLALRQLLVLSERSLSRQHVVRRQLIRKQKMPKEIVVIKSLSD